MLRLLCRIGWVLVLMLVWNLPTYAAQESHTRVSLVTEFASVQPGQSIEVGLRLVMDKDWHTYWKNPGDSGLATTIKWTLPPGFRAGPIQWPMPHQISAPPLMSYGYQDEALLITAIDVPATAKPGSRVELKADVEWLECKDICLPGAAKLSLSLPVKAEKPQPVSAEMTALFAKTRAQWPKKINEGVVSVYATTLGNQNILQLAFNLSDLGIAGGGEEVYFFADDAEWVESSAKQIRLRVRTGENLSCSLSLTRPASAAPIKQLSGVLVWDRSSFGISSPVQLLPKEMGAGAAPGSSNPTLLLSLIFAFLGGVILNLMPCVLPVLSLKVFNLVKQAEGHQQGAWRHGVAFTAGVVLSFWVLAGLLLGLRAAGQELGWGFQMQSPHFVLGLAILFFVFALNLFGVFEVGTSLTGVDSAAAQRGGVSGSFGMGALATLAATPCTAPFMGAALGFAVSQPPVVAFLVFTFLALGMASPYLVLALCPALLRYVPKPGAWMVAFKQLLGFLLVGTVIFLLWVFGQQAGINAMTEVLGALLLIGFSGWIYGRWSGHRLALAIALLVALGGATWGWRAASSGTPTAQAEALDWIPYSPQRLAELRAEGKPVFLDFTAAWCLSCKVNEAVALNNAEVQKKLKESGIVLMKADWTRRDAEIAQALASYGRSGVPLYVLYGRGVDAQPQILPEVLTPGIVLDAVEKVK